jgi:hypothetical protein
MPQPAEAAPLSSHLHRTDLPRHWCHLDQLNLDMVTIREALEACALPFFQFHCEAIGGRPFLRVGLRGHDTSHGPFVIWGKPWMVSGKIEPADVARVALERCRDLLLREAANQFTFEGRHIFKKDG